MQYSFSATVKVFFHSEGHNYEINVPVGHMTETYREFKAILSTNDLGVDRNTSLSGKIHSCVMDAMVQCHWKKSAP